MEREDILKNHRTTAVPVVIHMSMNVPYICRRCIHRLARPSTRHSRTSSTIVVNHGEPTIPPPCFTKPLWFDKARKENSTGPIREETKASKAVGSDPFLESLFRSDNTPPIRAIPSPAKYSKPKAPEAVDKVQDLKRREPRDVHPIEHSIQKLGQYFRESLETIPAGPLPVTSQSKKGQSEREQSEWTDDMFNAFHREATDIEKNKDLKRAISLWETVEEELRNRHSSPRIQSSVFVRLIQLFNKLQSLEKAIEVWNCMLSFGYKPEIRHWTSMISGCSQAHDPEAMTHVWINMLDSGVKPDNKVYGAYIRGMIKTGGHRQGLDLLERLGKDWKSGWIPGGPSLEPIRGALSGLKHITTRLGFDFTIRLQEQVIAWARRQGLTPDTRLYNIVIGTIAGKAKPSLVKQWLDKMQSDCQPDIITWTVILKGIVATKSPFFTMRSEEQCDFLKSILAKMDEKNLHPNQQTYGTLLFGLLDARKQTPNIAAARMVQDHMLASGIPPSNEIYTTLLMHHFKSSPPDLPAIQALLDKLLRQNQGHASLDGVFWNRVISNYAQINEWEKALHYLRHRGTEKQVMSWETLWQLLSSLQRAAEWDICTQLVDEIGGGGIMTPSATGNDHDRYVDEVDRLRSGGIRSSMNRSN